MRAVFFGTPEFAVTVLRKLGGRVVAVVSQPDRAKDRRGELVATPVKQYAIEAGIPVFQFEKIALAADKLRQFDADIFITAAYGQKLTREILDIPKFGVVNVHASILPKYRGSSPVSSAILAGEEQTGVTIMQTDEGMDTGDILAVRTTPIGDKGARELTRELAEMGGDLLIETLDRIENGSVSRTKQVEAEATKCKKIDKESARIRWQDDSRKVCRFIRAYDNGPIAFTEYRGERVRIYEAERCEDSGDVGAIVRADRGGIVVACGSGAIKIKSMQLPGKKIMSDTEIVNGKKLTVGEYFGK